MKSLAKCRASGGSSECVDVRCPERVQYSEILHSLSSERLSVSRKLELMDIRRALERRNPKLRLESVSHSFVRESNGDRYTNVNTRDYGMIKSYYGDLTSDSDLLKLDQADPKREYQLGECGTLAGQLWHKSPHVEDIYYLKNRSDPQFGIHMFVKLKDGSFVDSLGVWSEEKLVERWSKVDSSVKMSIFVDPEGRNIEKDPAVKIYNKDLYNVLDKIISERF